MSRDVQVRLWGRKLRLPLGAIDKTLNADIDDSFTFGTVREMIANNVYLRAFKSPLYCPCVLDLGCNRGMFSLIALKMLDAKVVIGVEPLQKYNGVRHRLANANGVLEVTTKSYWKKAGSSSAEKRDGSYVSVNTILTDNKIETLDFVKVDIEGAEVDVFSDEEWLARTQHIAMELHPHMVDVFPVIGAVKNSGFHFKVTDQFGMPCAIKDASYLYASRNPSCFR
jgi:hypothetical protein